MEATAAHRMLCGDCVVEEAGLTGFCAFDPHQPLVRMGIGEGGSCLGSSSCIVPVPIVQGPQNMKGKPFIGKQTTSAGQLTNTSYPAQVGVW